MKFIKNGVIYEPHNDFVIAQMQKSGFIIYEEEQKSVKTEEKACENVEATSEKPKEVQKKKKK